MLILARKISEQVLIAGGAQCGGVTITVVEVKGDRVRLGFDAPKDLSINRQEVEIRILRDGKEAA